MNSVNASDLWRIPHHRVTTTIERLSRHGTIRHCVCWLVLGTAIYDLSDMTDADLATLKTAATRRLGATNEPV